MAPTILGVANAILAIPNAPGAGSTPTTDFNVITVSLSTDLTSCISVPT